MDADYAIALSLQEEFSTIDNEVSTDFGEKRKRPESIVDDCWETIDPTPDIRDLFLQFNDTYFDGRLLCCEVKWAPRMTLCAGVCCYEGRGGLCSIKLSMPLLKLRPRKDLVQTLLHEMIHAYLFVTHNNKDHNAHGPEFHKHMHRINRQSGANITVYHNFHDEVDLYRQHWWRCDGPCQKRPPYYGMVKRAMNRAPSPRDPWWSDHQKKCGGTYHKVREPEDYGNKKQKKNDETARPSTSKDDEATKGTPKIYDLFKKEGKDGKTDNTFTKSKSNGSKEIAKKTGGNISNDSMKNKTNIERTWRVDNDDGNNCGKENELKKVNNKFIPFAGKGHVLGSNKGQSKLEVLKHSDKKQPSTGTVTVSLVKDQESSQIGNPKGNILPSQSNKNVIDINEDDFPEDSTRSEQLISNKNIKGQKNNFESDSTILNRPQDMHKIGTQLTIVDAFKKVGEKKIPLVVIEESTPGASMEVQCPVCLINIEEKKINFHLDGCLKKF